MPAVARSSWWGIMGNLLVLAAVASHLFRSGTAVVLLLCLAIAVNIITIIKQTPDQRNYIRRFISSGRSFLVIFCIAILSYDIYYYHVHALEIALVKGDVERVEALIDKGYDVNAETENGQSMLTWAFWYPYPNKKLFSDEPILRLSPQEREAKIEAMLKILIDHGADINRLDSGGSTPLLCAVGPGYYHIVKMLIDKGADVNLADPSDHLTPLRIALNRHRKKIAQLLREHGAHE